MSKSHYIRDRRLEMGISQTQLAQRTGISRQRISDYEARRYRPCEQTMEKLARILGPDLTKVPVLRAAAQKVTRPRPATVPFEAVFAATWVRFSHAYFTTLRRIGFTEFPLWFCGGAPCDSALEYLAWALLVVAGAMLVAASPVERGFRRHPLLDHLGWALGYEPRPCLHWKVGELECLIWPQIIVQPVGYGYRVDALVLVCRGKQQKWCVLEIDGPQHTLKADKKRDATFKISVLRFPAPQILDLSFPTLLEQELLKLFV